MFITREIALSVMHFFISVFDAKGEVLYWKYKKIRNITQPEAAIRL